MTRFFLSVVVFVVQTAQFTGMPAAVKRGQELLADADIRRSDFDEFIVIDSGLNARLAEEIQEAAAEYSRVSGSPFTLGFSCCGSDASVVVNSAIPSSLHFWAVLSKRILKH